jgi:dihydrofolate reductase
MNLIVAVDKNWAIGYKNDLLVSIPDDMKYFREHTTGKVCIMGKNTLESFPGGRPLKNRVNIVIALEKSYKVDGATVVYSIEEALEEAKKYNTEDVYVIGGGSIYKQMLQYCIQYID